MLKTAASGTWVRLTNPHIGNDLALKDRCLLFRHEVPTFYSYDLDGVRQSFYRDGIAFIDGCDEQKLVTLGHNMLSLNMKRSTALA